MRGRLEGKVAVVTGAASGIGLGIARRFVAEGARVVLSDIEPERLAAAAGELGASACAVAGSVTDEADVEALMEAAHQHFGGLHIVVANAGGGGFSLLVDCEAAEWRRVVDLNLNGAFLTVKHGGRRAADGGSIILIASLNAVQPAEGMAAYCAAKAGVAMLAKVAAMELGHRAVRVNAIAPGLVQTPATAPFWEVPGIVDEFLDNTVVGRFAQPDDVAALALFLAADESTFVSGGLHLVDGGAALKRYPDLPGAMRRLTEGA